MNENSKKYTKAQRIGALICVILIVSVYLLALVFSFFSSETAKAITKAAIGCTIGLPLLTWGYIWMVGRLTHKHTIADFDTIEKLNPENYSADSEKEDSSKNNGNA